MHVCQISGCIKAALSSLGWLAGSNFGCDARRGTSFFLSRRLRALVARWLRWQVVHQSRHPSLIEPDTSDDETTFAGAALTMQPGISQSRQLSLGDATLLFLFYFILFSSILFSTLYGPNMF